MYIKVRKMKWPNQNLKGKDKFENKNRSNLAEKVECNWRYCK